MAKQLVTYLTVHGLLPRLQSAYRARHSTETALLKVTSDILSALDNGDLASLALLDLSAAFDTVDHDILLRRMRVSYGIDGVALQWFRSYLGGRTQFVKYRGCCSSKALVKYGVPQGSVLGPILFILYTADLVALIESHGLSPHLYADDSQILGSCCPTDTALLRHRMETCIADVGRWMSSNRLQLNTSKTEVMWFSSPPGASRLLHRRSGQRAAHRLCPGPWPLPRHDDVHARTYQSPDVNVFRGAATNPHHSALSDKSSAQHTRHMFRVRAPRLLQQRLRRSVAL